MNDEVLSRKTLRPVLQVHSIHGETKIGTETILIWETFWDFGLSIFAFSTFWNV